MHGYKRRKSAVNVSRLLAWCGNHLERGGADLALLVVQALRQQAQLKHQSAYSHFLPDSERSPFLDRVQELVLDAEAQNLTADSQTSRLLHEGFH